MQIEERPRAEEIYQSLSRQLAPYVEELSACESTTELADQPAYRLCRELVSELLTTIDRGDCTGVAAPARTRYRFAAWNIERGTQLEAQIEAFSTHEYLRTSDVVLLTECDVGMARSGNHAVTRKMARALGFHYAFAPCYFSLVKGSGLEYYTPGENEVGLHGNAVLSRYPIGRVRAIPLKNGIDKMAGREKRLGCQTALAADIEFPNLTLTAVSVHLDANSTQRHRCEQMRHILDAVDNGQPVLLGGDWNTSTYNSSRAFHAIMGFALRVLMGVDNVIRNHYLYPERRFERELFRLLEARGFDYSRCNQLGERTAGYSIGDAKARHNLGEWVPGWCFAFIRWSLRNHGGQCPLKLDWFASRGLRCEEPVIIHEFREGREVPLSDHDPIGVDVIATP